MVPTSRESLRAALLIEPRLPRVLCVGAPADTGLAASVPSGVAFRGARSLESRRAASANDPLPRGAAGGTRNDSLFLQLLLASLFESLRAALLMEPRLRGAKCVADVTDPDRSVPAPGISSGGARSSFVTAVRRRGVGVRNGERIGTVFRHITRAAGRLITGQ